MRNSKGFLNAFTSELVNFIEMFFKKNLGGTLPPTVNIESVTVRLEMEKVDGVKVPELGVFRVFPEKIFPQSC